MVQTPGDGPSPGARPPGRTPRNARQTPSTFLLPFESPLRWGVLMGGLMIVVDLATRAMQQRLPEGADTGALLAGANLLLNALFLSILGTSVLRQTGRVRLAALGGLVAGLLDGIVVGAASALAPPGNLGGELTPGELWLEMVLQNLVLGVVLASLSAWIGTLARRGAGR